MYQTIKELARSIGVPYYRIQYAHERGLLPEPMRIAGNRVYSEEDAQRVRDYFVAKVKAEMQALSLSSSEVGHG